MAHRITGVTLSYDSEVNCFVVYPILLTATLREAACLIGYAQAAHMNSVVEPLQSTACCLSVHHKLLRSVA